MLQGEYIDGEVSREKVKRQRFLPRGLQFRVCAAHLCSTPSESDARRSRSGTPSRLGASDFR